MKQNKYDDSLFFDKYSNMERSKNGLEGFEITGVVEPKPAENLLYSIPGMLDELRRPMMLLVSARKKKD